MSTYEGFGKAGDQFPQLHEVAVAATAHSFMASQHEHVVAPRNTQSFDVDKVEVVESNARLLQAISQADFLTYSLLVDENLTCFEPQACGHLVRGVPFHKYYFQRNRNNNAEAENVSIVDPDVKVIGDVRQIASRGNVTLSSAGCDHVLRTFVVVLCLCVSFCAIADSLGPAGRKNVAV